MGAKKTQVGVLLGGGGGVYHAWLRGSSPVFSLDSWAVGPREDRAVFPGLPAGRWGPGAPQSPPALTEPAGVWGLVQN